ncbi:MAG TPA: class I SAM-dependent rRNA methyltransferase [Syntrophorhabdales bacterium]|nr:class I SAM-dependent rRNA methyltransferase [Syntrophorhabdales bacterium]
MERVVVDKAGENSVASGHVWIFSNEVRERPDGLSAGELVEIYTEKGGFLGIGYINPRSLIMVRMLTRQRIAVDQEFFERRISRALKLREGRFQGSFRVVNAESDFLPGLVIDKYEDALAIQLLTCGMEMQKEMVLGAAERVLSPETMVLRNESPARQEEGLPQYTQLVKGSVEPEMTIQVGPLRFLVDLMAGQKTGFYFDQRENRLLVGEFADGATVLDCFSYTCAFGLYALHFGARSATFVDTSSRALELGQENMRINRLSGGEFIKGDVFDFLKASDREYDLVILDPPSFIKSRKKLKEGERGYIDLHKKAMRRLAAGAHLFTFSCSHHMKRQRLRDVVRIAAYGKADIYLLAELSQSVDHPVILTIPETEYLKGLILRVEKR